MTQQVLFRWIRTMDLTRKKIFKSFFPADKLLSPTLDTFEVLNN